MNKLLFAMVVFSATCKAVDINVAAEYTKDALKRYESAVQKCIESRTSIVSLTDADKATLKSIQYSPAIIPYLEERAFSLCTMEEKMRYTEALILLEKANTSDANVEISKWIAQQKQDNFHVVELKIHLAYRALPTDIKTKLESLEGLHKPFNGLYLQQLIWPETK